ncbi:MAG: adenosylmethionine decarboxylase [Alphaproteobacteria bacterium]|nr:adenosylmethionine decarboxylase [Alphaproteobacteria bacterium]
MNASLAVSGQRPTTARNVPDRQKPKLVPKVVSKERVLEDGTRPSEAKINDVKGYFIEQDGLLFAGRHLIVELWDAKNLDNIEIVDAMMREAAEAAGATLLDVKLHHFGPNCGLSGLALLAESHISIHTWPERGYAAIDVFMCGACNPHDAVPAMKRALQAGQVQISEHKRGIIT